MTDVDDEKAYILARLLQAKAITKKEFCLLLRSESNVGWQSGTADYSQGRYTDEMDISCVFQARSRLPGSEDAF